LIVRFQSCEGAQWAINRYDGQTINQRELRVTIAVDGPHRNRKREVKWESTNLAKITETADVDEDVE
jgi:RNA recognition motif-containing protein